MTAVKNWKLTWLYPESLEQCRMEFEEEFPLAKGHYLGYGHYPEKHQLDFKKWEHEWNVDKSIATLTAENERLKKVLDQAIDCAALKIQGDYINIVDEYDGLASNHPELADYLKQVKP